MTDVAPRADASPALWPIACESEIGSDRALDLYRMYLSSFAHLKTSAAARQILCQEEFLEEMADARIAKYTVWLSEHEPVALATATNQLEAVPWISPDFFAARYPDHAARGAIYYLGIACVAPRGGQFRLLERLVNELIKPCVNHKGVLAYDVCAFNDLAVQFGRRAEAILRRAAPVKVSVADTQTYFQAVFE